MDPATLLLIGTILKATGWVFLPVLLLPIIRLVFPTNNFIADLQFTLIELIDGFNVRMGEWVKWLLVALVVSVAFGVIALSIFGQAWTKFDESSTYFHATVILLGSAATLLAGQHVRVDIVYTRLKSKAKALVDVVGFYALLVPFCLVLIWNAQNFVMLSWKSFEGSPESDGIQGVFILKTLVSVFAISLLLQGMSIAGRAVNALLGAPSPDLPEKISPLFEDDEHTEAGL